MNWNLREASRAPDMTEREILRLVRDGSLPGKLIADVLRSREGLTSTGIGGGIAIPHPRDPMVLHVKTPIMFLCFLAQDVDFKAIDGQPVRVLLVLLSPTISLHLQLLARLAHALHDDALCQLLRRRADGSAVLSRIRQIDSRINGSAPEDHT